MIFTLRKTGPAKTWSVADRFHQSCDDNMLYLLVAISGKN